MYIEDENYSISIDSNKEYKNIREREFSDGFLYFKLLIEIDFLNEVDVEFLTEVTGIILKYLWANNYSAVTACPYEASIIENAANNGNNASWLK